VSESSRPLRVVANKNAAALLDTEWREGCSCPGLPVDRECFASVHLALFHPAAVTIDGGQRSHMRSTTSFRDCFFSRSGVLARQADRFARRTVRGGK
jgi:hypothetical protein